MTIPNSVIKPLWSPSVYVPSSGSWFQARYEKITPKSLGIIILYCWNTTYWRPRNQLKYARSTPLCSWEHKTIYNWIIFIACYHLVMKLGNGNHPTNWGFKFRKSIELVMADVPANHVGLPKAIPIVVRSYIYIHIYHYIYMCVYYIYIPMIFPLCRKLLLMSHKKRKKH